MADRDPHSGSKPLRQPPARLIDLKELMGSAREIQLYHRGQVYRLRLTKADKLILTK